MQRIAYLYTMINESAKSFFETYTQSRCLDFKVLAQSGSSRINFLAETPARAKFIITYNANTLENEAFFYFSEVFSKLKLNTPKIYKVSADRKLYIQEFLGENTLSEIITSEGLSLRVEKLVKQCLDQLFCLQQSTIGEIDYTKTFEYERYDALPVSSDLFYFKCFIADVLELPYHKAGLLKEFKKIAAKIENTAPKVLMLRDFQARNILVGDNENISFIDYQAAMQGPAMYDAVSFLFQAKAGFPESFREKMLTHFISLHDEKEIRLQLENSVQPLKLIRFLQVLGAYGFRGLIQKKHHFSESLGYGIRNLKQFSEDWEGMRSYPNLHGIINNLAKPATAIKIHEII